MEFNSGFKGLNMKGNPRHPSDMNLNGNVAGLDVKEESVYVTAELYCDMLTCGMDT